MKQLTPLVCETLHLRGRKGKSASTHYNPLGKKGEVQRAQTQSQDDSCNLEAHSSLICHPFDEPHLSFIRERYSKGTESQSNKATQKGKGRESKPYNSGRKEEAEPGYYFQYCLDSRVFRSAARECRGHGCEREI